MTTKTDNLQHPQPESKLNEDVAKYAISFKRGFELTGLPIITLFQGDKRLNLLIDTGSNNCVIDKSVLSGIEYSPSEDKTNIYGLERASQTADRCRISTSYQGQQFEFDYTICDISGLISNIKEATGVRLHGILGCNFLYAFDFVLDFEHLLAYSKLVVNK